MQSEALCVRPTFQKLRAVAAHAHMPANTPWRRAFKAFQPMTMTEFAAELGLAVYNISFYLSREPGLIAAPMQYRILRVAKRLDVQFNPAILLPEV